MTKYPKLKEGSSFRVDLNKEDLFFACCDCGKVHHWQFHKISDGVYDFALFTERRATAQLRRHKYGTLQQNGKMK
jgi:hypothetical protein